MYRDITVHDYFIDNEDRTLYFVTKSGEFSKPFWLTQKQGILILIRIFLFLQ